MKNFDSAAREFKKLLPILELARAIELSRLSAFVQAIESDVSRVEGRVKDESSIIDNFLKYQGSPSSAVTPQAFFESCTDVIGLRVVVMYDADVDVMTRHLSKSYANNFEEIFSATDLVKGSTFGYRASHWKFTFADPAFAGHFSDLNIGCEIQVRTILSDAWAQHSHKLLYKPGDAVSAEQQRIFARAAAAVESIDTEMNRLAHGDSTSINRSKKIEEISVALSRSEAFAALRGLLSSAVSDSAIDTFVDQALSADLLEGPRRHQFVGDLKGGWDRSYAIGLDRYGKFDDLTRLRMGLFSLNKELYSTLVPPHLKDKAINVELLSEIAST